jgi:hypothetical protein
MSNTQSPSDAQSLFREQVNALLEHHKGQHATSGETFPISHDDYADVAPMSSQKLSRNFLDRVAEMIAWNNMKYSPSHANVTATVFVRLNILCAPDLCCKEQELIPKRCDNGGRVANLSPSTSQTLNRDGGPQCHKLQQKGGAHDLLASSALTG